MYRQGVQLRRYWILLVLRAARYCGFATVASDVFHRLVFFANTLAPTVDISSETPRVLKAEQGPFFPDYQWDLDRLVGMALVDVRDLSWASEDGRYFGKYRINNKGLLLSEEILRDNDYFAFTERAISEVVSAFSKTKGLFEPSSAFYDASYSQDTIRFGEVIDFGEWNPHNYTTDAALFLYEKWLNCAPMHGEPSVVVQGVSGYPDVSVEYKPGTNNDNEQRENDEEKGHIPPIESHYRKNAIYLYAHYLNRQMQ